MSGNSFMYGFYSRAPAILFALALWLVPDFVQDKRLSAPISVLNVDPRADDIAAVLSQPENTWHPHKDVRHILSNSGRSKTWLRMDIPAISDASSDQVETSDGGEEPWVVAANGSAISDIPRVEFYQVQNGRVVASYVTGGNFPETFSEQSAPDYLFKFKPSASKQFIYIKTEFDGDHVVRLNLYRSSDYRVQSTSWVAIWAILNGCLLGLGLYSLSLFVILRDRSFAYLAICQLCTVVVAAYFSRFGKAVLPLWSQSLDLTYSVVAVAQGLFFVSLFMFTGRFFDYRRNFPRMQKFLSWQLRFSVFVTLMIPFLPTKVIVGIFVVISVSAIVRHLLIHRKHIQHGFVFFFSMAIGFYIVGGLMIFLMNLGVVESTQMRDMAFHLGAVLHGAALSVSMTQRLKFLEKRHVEIVGAMSHDASLVRLNSLLNESFAGHFNTSDLDVSMMFVDIAAFSQISTSHSDSDVYGALAQLLEDVVAIIEAHGGAIDRSVGAGVLCVFGYKRDGKFYDPALDAFKAACKIQEMTVQITVNGKQKIIMPIRIGIHAAKVTIGNIGDQTRIDFTMIGSGVNLASRLKEACSPYKIIVSRTVFEHLQAAGYQVSSLSPISIAIKHKVELLRAYEFNPFSLTSELLTKAETVFLDYLGLRSMDQRYRVKKGHVIMLENDFCKFQVLDFSRFGFRGIGPQLLGRQTVIQVRIKTTDPRLDTVLKEALLAEFALEVRWSKDVPNGYEHGFKIFGGGARQSEFLFQTLREYFAGDSDKSEVDDLVVELAS